jgi:hypothetical protein
LVFNVLMGLRKGLSLIPTRLSPPSRSAASRQGGIRRLLTDEQEKLIAETIVRELEASNWKITRGEPGRPPG